VERADGPILFFEIRVELARALEPFIEEDLAEGVRLADGAAFSKDVSTFSRFLGWGKEIRKEKRKGGGPNNTKNAKEDKKTHTSPCAIAARRQNALSTSSADHSFSRIRSRSLLGVLSVMAISPSVSKPDVSGKERTFLAPSVGGRSTPFFPWTHMSYHGSADAVAVRLMGVGEKVRISADRGMAGGIGGEED
jgi:hypothetical protein